jgi:hypothetical protein
LDHEKVENVAGRVWGVEKSVDVALDSTGACRQPCDIPALTFLKTKLVGKIDQHVLDLLLGQRDVGILTPRRLSKKNKRRRRRFFCFSYDRERQEKT